MTNQTLDGCLQLVADRHRRRIIRHLREEAGETAAFEDLVDQVYSQDAGSESGSPRSRRELVIQLQHVHLPKLTKHGVVEFDRRSGTVRYLPDEQVESVLDSLPSELSIPRA